MIYCISADSSAQISVVHLLLGDSVVWCISSSTEADQAGEECLFTGIFTTSSQYEYVNPFVQSGVPLYKCDQCGHTVSTVTSLNKHKRKIQTGKSINHESFKGLNIG